MGLTATIKANFPVTVSKPYTRPGRAVIEAALYKAEVPERYFRQLVSQLSGTPQDVLNSAMMLYGGLVEDRRLTKEQRVALIPELVELIRKHGPNVHMDAKYVDSLVANYLTQDSDAAIKQTRVRFRDQRVEKENIPYGSAHGVVTYGRFAMNPERAVSRIKSQTIGTILQPSYMTEVQKVQELVIAVSHPNPDWKYARELIMDLNPRAIVVFPGNKTLYNQLLSNLGTVIRSELPVVVRLKYHGKGRNTQIPIGFKIKPYETPQRETMLEEETVEHFKGDGYVNRTGRFVPRRDTLPTITKAVVTPNFKVVHVPHRTLERRVAQFSR